MADACDTDTGGSCSARDRHGCLAASATALEETLPFSEPGDPITQSRSHGAEVSRDLLRSSLRGSERPMTNGGRLDNRDFARRSRQPDARITRSGSSSPTHSSTEQWSPSGSWFARRHVQAAEAPSIGSRERMRAPRRPAAGISAEARPSYGEALSRRPVPGERAADYAWFAAVSAVNEEPFRGSTRFSGSDRTKAVPTWSTRHSRASR